MTNKKRLKAGSEVDNRKLANMCHLCSNCGSWTCTLIKKSCKTKFSIIVLKFYYSYEKQDFTIEINVLK